MWKSLVRNGKFKFISINKQSILQSENFNWRYTYLQLCNSKLSLNFIGN